VTRPLQRLDPALLPDDLKDEVKWEREAVERGVKRYRDSLFDEREDGSVVPVGAADTRPGMAIMRDCMRPLVAAIREAQAEAIEGLGSSAKQGRPQIWWYPILCLGAEKIAFIVLKTVLSAPHRESKTSGHNLPAARTRLALAREIGRHIQTEREFEMWRDQENKLAKEQKRPNYWYMLRNFAPQVDERAFKKFSKQSGQYVRMEWSLTLRVHIGTRLLALLIEQGGGWFEQVYVLRRSTGGRRFGQEARICLTQKAYDWMEDRHGFNEEQRPWLLPMLVQPLDWAETEVTNAQERVVEDTSPTVLGDR
jgi:DNA-directed RNA polymerase